MHYWAIQEGLNAGGSVAAHIPTNPGANSKGFGLSTNIAGITGSVAGATLTIATAATTATVATSSALTVVAIAGAWAAVLVPVLIILAKIFKGADPRQVPASQIEQAFEAASDNLYVVAKVGMITKEQAAYGMQLFLQKGVEYYAQMPQLGKAGNKGAGNMGKIIKDEITAVLALPVVAPVPINITKAHALYKANFPGGGKGWYAKSVEAGNKLADDFLKAVQEAGSSPAQAAAGSASGPGATAAAVAAVAGSPSKLFGLGVGAFAVVGLLRKIL